MKRITNFLSFLVMVNMLFMSFAQSIVEASMGGSENTSAQSQILSNDEMKEIVGGRRIVKQIVQLFPLQVKGNIKEIPANTKTLKIKGISCSADVTFTWYVWDHETHKGQYEVRFDGPAIWKLVYVEAVACDDRGIEIDKTYVWLFNWGGGKINYDLSF